jgi:hypothetical protein
MMEISHSRANTHFDGRRSGRRWPHDQHCPAQWIERDRAGYEWPNDWHEFDDGRKALTSSTQEGLAGRRVQKSE